MALWYGPNFFVEAAKDKKMKDAYYFSHDCNARRDPKIVALMSKYGAEGYGVFFILIEILAEQHSYKIEKFPKIADGLAKESGVPTAKFSEILTFIITECELLKQDERYIWSESLMRRKLFQEEKRQLRVEAGRIGGIRSGEARGSKTKQNEALLEANEANEAKESIVKNSKAKERKGEGEADPPTIHDVREMAEAEKIQADPDKFFHYQESKGGWAGLVDWKAAFRYWARSEFKKPQDSAVVPQSSRVWVDKDADVIKKKNAWHDAHLKGGKCSFCGSPVPKLGICLCDEYNAAFDKFCQGAA